jgi:hypothetical protein
MDDPIVRGVIERSLFSSLSLTQINFATFPAKEFMFAGLDEFVELTTAPAAPTISESEFRRGLAAVSPIEMRSRLEPLIAEVGLGLYTLPDRQAALTKKRSPSERTDLIMMLLEKCLSDQAHARSPAAEAAALHQLKEEISKDRVLHQRFGEYNLSTGQAAFLVSVLAEPYPEAPQSVYTLNTIMSYEIPFSLSPQVHSESLRAVIQEAKRFAVLPLYAGSLGAATEVTTGNFVTAFEMAAAGGGATIIVAGSAAIADRLLALLARR